MVSRTRVKICGITSPEDALMAARCGADALGLVFHEASARAVDVAQACRIRESVPALTGVIALFVDPGADRVRQVLEEVSPDCIQFHGNESPAFCESFGRPYMKAIRVRSDLDVGREAQRYASAAGILLDAWHPREAGGTGQTFDWGIARELVAEMPDRVVLAGGLRSGNVAEAIRAVQPWAVDVSSGVEDSPGNKSGNKLTAFFREVQGVHADDSR